MSETKGPRELREDAGTKYYCTCGKSKNFPYCDGSHEGTDKEPRQEEVAEERTIWVCECGKSANMPFCDGSHEA